MICNTHNSLAYEVLELERQFFGDVVCRASQQIDHFVALFQNIHLKRRSIRNQISLLNRVLFRDHKLRFCASKPSRNFTLTGTLLDGRGNCLGLTLVYMAIADRVNVPVRPMLYEGHIALCFEAEGQHYPVEVSRAGAILQGRLAELMYFGKGDGRVLTNLQLLAVHMSNQAAFVYAPTNDYETAQFLLESAVEVFPGYMAAWINLSALFIRLNELDKAVDSLDRVMNLSPSGPYLKHALAMMEQIVQGRLPSGHHIA